MPFVGDAVTLLFEALRGFDSRWCHWNFSLTWRALWPWNRLSLWH